MRPSLLFSLKKAARLNLRPDGSEGALIPRWDNDARTKLVSFQPMYKGTLRLGRRAGAVKEVVADIVFAGEPFRNHPG